MTVERCIRVKRSPTHENWWVVLELTEDEQDDVILGIRDTMWEADLLRDHLQMLSDSIITA